MKKSILLLPFFFVLFAKAATYYVSNTGKDSDNGSAAAPFYTIGKAESVAVAGDIVILNPGTYTSAYTLTKAGIIYRGPGALLTGIITVNANNRTFDGLSFTGTSQMNIFGAGNFVKNCRFTVTGSVGYGIKVGIDGNTGGEAAMNNTIDSCMVTGTTQGTIHGVLFGGGATGNILRNSYISNTYYGLVDKATKETQCYNNIFDFKSGGLFTCYYAKGSSGSRCYSNTFNNAGSGYGVCVNVSDGGTPVVSGLSVTNNVFIKNISDPAIYNGSSANTFISDYNSFGYTSGLFAFSAGVNYSGLSAWQTTGNDINSVAGGGLPVSGSIYYVATNGNDANFGTIDRPFGTLQKISSLPLQPGDIVYVREGTYKSGTPGDSPQWSWKLDGFNGNSNNWITISAYPGERVTFDCGDYKHTGNHFGIYITNSSYLKVKGIRVTGIPQIKIGQVCIGWWTINNKGAITLENCEADHIGNTGFRLDNTTPMIYLNCDAHHIDNPMDTGVQHHGMSDGFGRYDPGNTSTNTVYKGCRAWFCSDDGWDCFGSPGTITYDGCWSFWAGYVQDVFPLTHTLNGDEWGDGNGFKFGSISTQGKPWRYINNCISFENHNNGFDQNASVTLLSFQNNTAYNNININYFQYSESGDLPHIAKNNISYKARVLQNFQSATTQTGNSWQIGTVTDADFISLSSKGMDAARATDGSLPVLNFLLPVKTSRFAGIGALPVDITTPPVDTIPPVIDTTIPPPVYKEVLMDSVMVDSVIVKTYRLTKINR